MKLHLVVILGSVVLGFCGYRAEGRDLSQYDLAGPYSLDRTSRHAEERPLIEAEIRDFLWKKWAARHLARVATVEYGLEGRATRTWYYIECDSIGSWHVVIDRDVTLAAIDPKTGEHLRENTSYMSSIVERVEVSGSDTESVDVISDSQTR